MRPSVAFVKAVRLLLERDVAVLATVALHGQGFIAEVKSWPGVQRVEVRRDNRDAWVSTLVRRLKTERQFRVMD